MVGCMKAMIPHHPMAIRTSRRAGSRPRRVCSLAGGIIDTQEREIAGLKRLMSDIEARH
jgi:uncharacterized protein (DUF305 family)